jgi:uncharacterized protein (DUF1684 family)
MGCRKIGRRALLWVLPALPGAGVLLAVSTYESEILKWRQEREASLKAEDGWLTLAGLSWFHEGANRFGKDPSCDIPLPDGPAQAGVFEFHSGKVTLGGREIKPNVSEPIHIGRLSLSVIRRADKVGIRVRDPESEARRHFHGLESFPISEQYRITAQWVAEPRDIPILNVIGQTSPSPSPGYAVFHLHGRELKLRPIIEEPGAKELFYIFRDQTAGKETYGAGRFFYSDMPHDGKVVLDFNKAYNPPCAFTPYATCPLPPENRLAVRIEAGEKKYGDH